MFLIESLKAESYPHIQSCQVLRKSEDHFASLSELEAFNF